jgi:hypothetical protein
MAAAAPGCGSLGPAPSGSSKEPRLPAASWTPRRTAGYQRMQSTRQRASGLFVGLTAFLFLSPGLGSDLAFFALVQGLGVGVRVGLPLGLGRQ